MSDNSTLSVCPECGARVTPGADRCELCGTELAIGEPDPSVDQPDDVQPETPLDPRLPASQGAELGGKPAEPRAVIYCSACGRPNRSEALFCDQCGTPLQRFHITANDAPPATPTPKGTTMPQRPPRRADDGPHSAPLPATGPAVSREDAGVGAQAQGGAPVQAPAKSKVGLLLIGAIVVVVVLYLLSAMGKSSAEQPATAPQAATAQQSTGADLNSYLPEDDGLAEQSAPIMEAIDAETDSARKTSLRGQLIELYATSGRLDLAGREEEQIAADANTAEEWAHAGNFHFDWMEQQSGDERVKAAQRAAAAYQKSLELDPDNLDVRTDLGVAYLNDPASPMLAIKETNAVLEKDPDHVQANFNKAVMLLQIGRNDEAVALLEKVLSLSEPGSSPHDRAVEILNQIRSGAG